MREKLSNIFTQHCRPESTLICPICTSDKRKLSFTPAFLKVNAARKSKVDDNTAKMQSIKQLGV